MITTNYTLPFRWENIFLSLTKKMIAMLEVTHSFFQTFHHCRLVEKVSTVAYNKYIIIGGLYMKTYDVKNSMLDRKVFYTKLVVFIVLLMIFCGSVVFSFINMRFHFTDTQLPVYRQILVTFGGAIMILIGSKIWLDPLSVFRSNQNTSTVEEIKRACFALLIMIISICWVVNSFL